MARGPGDEKILAGGVGARWRFELEMHPAQQEIFQNPARFKVVAAGRRFGKTILGSAEILVAATAKPDANVWWVAPSHAQTRIAMRQIARVVPAEHREINRTLGEIYLSNGGRIALKSAERPDNLRGEGLDLVVVDEAAFVPRDAWTQAIRPALSDRQGKALLISTFDGENWFWDLYRDAIDPENTEWEGWKLPTSANPYIPAEEIEEARRNLPKEVFGQEYLASPLAFHGAVFDAESLELGWDKGKSVVKPPNAAVEGGIDWGHRETAFMLNFQTPNGDVVWFEEHVYKKIELTERCEDIARICVQHNVQTLYTDAAGPTENYALGKILDRTPNCRTVIQPIPFNVWKMPSIMARNFYLENEREVLAPGVRQFYADSKAYRYDEAGEKPLKGKDHTVDAATAFYASRVYELGDELMGEAA